MRHHFRSHNFAHSCFVNVFFISAVILLMLDSNVTADEVPAFFLKIAKNTKVPRVGRSGRFDDFFFKSGRNIPRIGRRDGNDETSESWSSYGNDEPFVEPSKRRMEYPALTDPLSWQHFPLAIEGPRELWRTLAGYSTDTSDELDNEVWQRKKRTGNSLTN